MSEKKLTAKRRREITPYMGGSGRVPESAGRGYEAPHRASVANLSAKVRYAANVDRDMVAIKGQEPPSTLRRPSNLPRN